MWYLFVFNQYSYFRDFFCSGPASRLRELHHHGWVHYMDTTKITTLRFVWDRSVFTQCSYYCDFFCSETALRLHDHHHHRWVHYMDTTKITVWCVSLLLLSIDLQWLFYFIMFYFKLTNGAMVKRCMVKWCNGEIKIRIGRLVSHIYLICSFFFLSKTKVL